MFKIAIIEDDVEVAEQLKSYVGRYEKENNEVFEVDCFYNPINFFEKQQKSYDIIFLDIKMPDMNGLSVAKEIRKLDEKVVIIFVTNLVQYAIKGYEVNAMDYMVKPVSYSGFFLRLQKALALIKSNTSKYILLNLPYSVMRIPVSSIYYIEVRGHTLFFETERGLIETRGALGEYESRLKDCGFMRCSRFTLINMRRIDRVSEKSVYINDKTIPISKVRNKEFLDAVKQLMSNKVFTQAASGEGEG